MNLQPEQQIKNYLAKIIADSSENLIAENLISDFSDPPEIKLGEFAFGCFKLAKELKSSPIEIAKNLASQIKVDSIIDEIQAAGPYLNFKLNSEYFNKLILENNLYEAKSSKNQKIMLEYSGPNPCKTFHVGHFRNTILGSAMINLYRYNGFEVVPVNYLNDTGTHVAKVIWIYLKSYQGKEPQSLQGRWLGELYVEANNFLEEDSTGALMEEVYKIHRKLESGDEQVLKLLKQFKEWSVVEFDKIYDQLDAEFDIVFYDSEYINSGKGVVNELVDKGIAKKSEGAIIVDLEDSGLNIALILKSDGSAVYMTKDLAMAQDRFKKFNVDKLVYVVGSEQILHFRQIFKILELNGFEKAKDCFHLAYELVNTSSGKKMSTREGTVVLYHEIYDEAFEMAYLETKNRHDNWQEENLIDVASKIALCALKFDMLKQDAQKKIKFDIKKALDVSGDTGPYVMYTMARLRSIIKKGKLSDVNLENLKFDLLQNDDERSLIKKLCGFDSVLVQASTINKPSLVAHYLLELSRLANHYYHSTTILDESNAELQNIRLILLQKIVSILESGFEVLNIRWIEEM